MPALLPRASTLLKAAIAAGAAIATGLLLSQCGQPKASANGFDVALSFTPAASAKLKALGQKAVVDAYFYGLPTEATAAKVDEEGHINLGESFASADGADQTTRIDANAIDPAMMDKIKKDSAAVTVRAYLDPTAGVANMLDCSIFNGPLIAAQARPVAIRCDLMK
ncbi:MAG TPA: hypothetical protein VF402_06395 [Asticcacaulis sp.]